jgi:hypothetical protein
MAPGLSLQLATLPPAQACRNPSPIAATFPCFRPTSLSSEVLTAFCLRAMLEAVCVDGTGPLNIAVEVEEETTVVVDDSVPQATLYGLPGISDIHE